MRGESFGTITSHQKLGNGLFNKARTRSLVRSSGSVETHEPKHHPSAPKPRVSLAIFDRDGTLIEDTGFPIDPGKIMWQSGALEAIAWLRSQGVLVAVATNQSGVARGYFTLERVRAFHAAMDTMIQAAGGRVDAYAICPHLIGGVLAEYAIECNCRKPKPGLINQLLEEFQVSPENAIVIGDRETDVLAGQTAGVASFLYDGGDLFEFTRVAISANFALGAVNSSQVTSKASRC